MPNGPLLPTRKWKSWSVDDAGAFLELHGRARLALGALDVALDDRPPSWRSAWTPIGRHRLRRRAAAVRRTLSASATRTASRSRSTAGVPRVGGARPRHRNPASGRTGASQAEERLAAGSGNLDQGPRSVTRRAAAARRRGDHTLRPPRTQRRPQAHPAARRSPHGGDAHARQGVPLKAVTERLAIRARGSQVDLYQHVGETMQDEAAARLGLSATRNGGRLPATVALGVVTTNG